MRFLVHALLVCALVLAMPLCAPAQAKSEALPACHNMTASNSGGHGHHKPAHDSKTALHACCPACTAIVPVAAPYTPVTIDAHKTLRRTAALRDAHAHDVFHPPRA